ncbi:M23 family metallopeptidase [Sneathiella glossodoripedis]|uniref:M23 family metallopeptidase n=1 Tax=Sneathiella glossodoripedis TaxID=418853 RepID=UPI00131ED9AC|nr:M23 family metallopeptidase [Sneathiella glossodoripedis]
MDIQAGPGAADFNCGSLTYNNHSGTDFRILTLKQMEKGVPVVAADDGVVFNLRDGVPDQYFSEYSKKKQKEVYSKGRGNVVVIQHGGGWNTFYAHLKKGSIRVVKGQRVSKGQVLGLVGMSGLTEFPHLHFELRHRNSRIDPFTGLEAQSDCGKSDRTFWSEAALRQMPYKETFFVNTGFSETRPADRKDLETGRKKVADFSAIAPTIYFWSYYIGSRMGDKTKIEIIGPDGSVLRSHTSKPAGNNQISRTMFIGMKKPATGWESGTYVGKITIRRTDGSVFEDSASINMR